ncbi:MAG: thiamine phosphate synthase [Verrucomicrobiae bacterium]|nr:thiamine phosphate synthase [Verrucomicrobiae bacterium]
MDLWSKAYAAQCPPITHACRRNTIQLRAKSWSPDRIEATAARLVPVCRDHGVRLVINDHPDIAARVGAPLVHLGQEDFFGPHPDHPAASAPSIPDTLGLGFSTHAPDQARRALAAGPAYIAIGPVFPTPTKPGRPAVTPDYVRWAATHLSSIPWFAIGGIHPGNLHTVLEAGATRICVVSAILNAPDPAAACRQFRTLLPP